MYVLRSCEYWWSFSRIRSEAFPSEDLFAANKDAVLYVGGSKDAFYANFQIPVTTIVSLKASLRCCTFANSFSRNSGLLPLELSFERLAFQL